MGRELRRPVVVLRRGPVKLDTAAYQNLVWLGGGEGSSRPDPGAALQEAKYAPLVVVDFPSAAACGRAGVGTARGEEALRRLWRRDAEALRDLKFAVVGGQKRGKGKSPVDDRLWCAGLLRRVPSRN